MKERQLVIDYLMENFSYSYEFAVNWINSSNVNFGGSSPEDLINTGKIDKIMLFLICAKEGY